MGHSVIKVAVGSELYKLYTKAITDCTVSDPPINEFSRFFRHSVYYHYHGPSHLAPSPALCPYMVHPNTRGCAYFTLLFIDSTG